MNSNNDEYAQVADLYDQVPLYHNRADIDFYVDAARQAGSPILELGCGTGRVLIPIARAGLEIVGIDESPQMLSICRARLQDEPREVQQRVQLVHGDMRSFQLERRFKLVTAPFRPFQHLLTVEDQLSCLDSVRRHLDDDGVLILDLFNPSLDALANGPIGKEFGEEPEFTTPDGRRIVRKHKTVERDPFNQIGKFELSYYVTHPDGTRERLVHAFSLRHLFRFEAEHLLARSGFEVEHVYADYNKSGYGSKYPGELLIVARKFGDRQDS